MQGIRKGSIVLAAALLAATPAMADWLPGTSVSVVGTASGNPLIAPTTWGPLGTTGTPLVLDFSRTFEDHVYGGDYTVFASSTVLAPTDLSVVFDYTNFQPGRFAFHTIDIDDLKTAGVIQYAAASQGTITITNNGHGIHWEGSGAALALDPTVAFFVSNLVPAPGALALLAAAGLGGGRRRR